MSASRDRARIQAAIDQLLTSPAYDRETMIRLECLYVGIDVGYELALPDDDDSPELQPKIRGLLQ